MKHVKLFFALFAMLALGVGNAWGAEETITLSTFGWSNASVQSSISATTATITLQQNSASTAPTYYTADGLRLYGVKSATTGGTISFTPKKGITISKIVFTHGSSNSGVLAIKTGEGSYSSSTKTWSGTLTEGNTVSLVSTNSGSKNPQVKITEIVITYETSGDEEIVPSLTKEQFSWSAAAASATLPDQFDEKPTLINTEDLAVTYSTSNDKVATIDANGNVTLVGVGTANINATAGDGVTFEETTVSYTLTVKPAPLVIEPIEGGIIDILTHNTLAATSSSYVEFTNKQAANENHSDAVYAGRSSRNGNATQYSIQLNSIDKGRIATTTSGGLAKRVYVKWATQGSANTNNRTLDIYGSNDAFTGSETTAPSTKIGTITFTTGAAEAYVDLTGDYKYILMTGSAAIYMDEIQVTWVADDTPEVPTLDAPTFSLAEDTYTEAQEVTLSAEEGTIYYTLDGTAPDAESIEYTTPIVLDECGEITIKAIAISGEITSSVASATYTIKLPLNNSQANPYTEADAIEVYDGGCYDNQEVYVMGVVKTAQFYNNSNTYTITLEGGFQFYKFYEAADEVTFTEDYIVAGDTLVACGKLVKYIETYELGAGCYLVDRKPYSEPKVDISNTPETAYTVAEAIALIDDITSDLTKGVYVKGQISEVESYNEKYGNITYWIQDAEGNKFECYGGLGLNQATFTSINDLVVGSQVVVYGTLKKHNSTYEFNYNNYIVSLTLPSYTVTVTVNDAAMGSVQGLAAEGTYEHGAEVTLTATPAFDYEFEKWSNGATENPLTITVENNIELQAIFAEVAATEVNESGKFSISAHKTATFATGNLQYHTSDNTWRFAKQQYQVVGEQNIEVGNPDFKGWIDMFGWSTSETYFGVDPSNSNELYDGEFVDWGKVFEGENWSTLSADEWKYLLNTRANATQLKQIATIDTILGIMLFPDAWVMPEGVEVAAKLDTNYNVNVYNYTVAQWDALEDVGAIFLPAAGRRTGGYGNMINYDQQVETREDYLVNGGFYRWQDNTNIYCYYWTSTINEDKNVSYLHNIVALGNDEYTIGTGAIWGEKGRYGQSVRLAKVAYDTHTVEVTAENGTVEGAGTYEHGATATLTAVANDGYEFLGWTVDDKVVSTDESYTFEVTSDMTLVANFVEVEPEVIAYELNGGELPLVGPTQEELWASFKTAIGLDTKALSELSSPVLNTIAGLLKGTTWYEGLDVPEWQWLKSYIQTIQANQAGQQFVDANGATRTVEELKDDISSDDNWRFAVAAFFAQSQYVGWPTATADFTEAGKPENWVNVYPDAQEVVLPTNPVAEDYVLPTPTKTGCTFNGWYDNAAGTGEAYTVIPAGWSGTLYAIWKQSPTVALENVTIEGQAAKAIINGQLIIIKNGIQYNAQGQVVK